MPRLAPRFNGNPAVIEHRMTLGDYARKLMTNQIEQNKKLTMSKQINNYFKPVVIGIATFGSAYFLSKAIDNIARGFSNLPLDNIQQSIRKGGNAIQGLNSDGSYPTILTVEDGRFPLGTVRTYDPGITGGIGSTAFLATINKTYEITVMGKFNKDATDVSQLSSGWLPYSQWKEANEDGREYVS